ncbi:DUF397 domain-containing protein [Actinomadura sp. DC4]|uniref:DUF397 domain-containing protein n=1 Tax=Actinomadura sp. DC4 TaxID=3055069 RepID=UPI0025B06316|nr:DUF397 domain-containing protein [Actinomadura sp. DC4]MDN3353430.1 DUF397 domain-containing protein [Actinomadura sp. DC4]
MNTPDWRKSSRSGGSGGNCVEVTLLPWRKSSRSGGACVEVAEVGTLPNVTR